MTINLSVEFIDTLRQSIASCTLKRFSLACKKNFKVLQQKLDSLKQLVVGFEKAAAFIGDLCVEVLAAAPAGLRFDAPPLTGYSRRMQIAWLGAKRTSRRPGLVSFVSFARAKRC